MAFGGDQESAPAPGEPAEEEEELEPIEELAPPTKPSDKQLPGGSVGVQEEKREDLHPDAVLALPSESGSCSEVRESSSDSVVKVVLPEGPLGLDDGPPPDRGHGPSPLAPSLAPPTQAITNKKSDEKGSKSKEKKKKKKKVKKTKREKKMEKVDALCHHKATVETQWGFWGQPLAKEHNVRSKHYLTNKKKVPSAPLLFKTVATQAFQGKYAVEHITQYPFSWYQRNKPPPGGFTFVHSIQIDSIGKSVVSYHYCADKSKLPKLFLDFCEKDDAFRNSRFKMIPKIVDGPWIVRSSVRSVPVIVGRKLNVKYFKGEDYLEVNMLCDSNFMASWIIGIAKPMSKSVVTELCWVVEGHSEEELPERLIAGVLLGDVDLNKFQKLTFDKDKRPITIDGATLKDVHLDNKVTEFYCETKYGGNGKAPS